ncbi:hypothetical protein ACQAYK_11725 [Acidithiobacillus sp. AC3]
MALLPEVLAGLAGRAGIVVATMLLAVPAAKGEVVERGCPVVGSFSPTVRAIVFLAVPAVMAVLVGYTLVLAAKGGQADRARLVVDSSLATMQAP